MSVGYDRFGEIDLQPANGRFLLLDGLGKEGRLAIHENSSWQLRQATSTRSEVRPQGGKDFLSRRHLHGSSFQNGFKKGFSE
jgi:hypothetical protein